ncbi:MAG: hypothetical protein Q8O92_00465 [Candidatus Latescibacter sp.]|nr:hypothetical protein [Candidatus Latescibacter sp.]
MNRALVLAAALALSTAVAHTWPFHIGKEIPKEFCRKYELLAEILPDKTIKNFENVPRPSAMIEPKRVILISGEIMEVETVIKVKKEGKSAFLVAFKGSSLSWILAEGKAASQLAVVQSDEKDRSRSKNFVFTRTNVLPADQ